VEWILKKSTGRGIKEREVGCKGDEKNNEETRGDGEEGKQTQVISR